jgi:hypothetical protein
MHGSYIGLLTVYYSSIDEDMYVVYYKGLVLPSKVTCRGELASTARLGAARIR